MRLLLVTRLLKVLSLSLSLKLLVHVLVCVLGAHSLHGGARRPLRDFGGQRLNFAHRSGGGASGRQRGGSGGRRRY